MNELLYRNKSWLQEQFDKYINISKVAQMTGYPRTCISRYATRYGIYKVKYNRAKDNTINKNYFNKINSCKKAYWLGFIMAEGNMFCYKDNHKIQFSVKLKYTDKRHLEKLIYDINFSGKIKERASYRNGKRLMSCEIQIYNKEFCKNLINKGIIPNKTGKEYIPECLDKKYYIDFIRGYLDGDGTITGSMTYKHILKVSVCSTSLLVIEQIKNYIKLYLNIPMHINIYKNVYTLSCTKKSDNYKLLKTLYYERCISLDRKRKLAKLALREYKKEYLK